MDYLYVIIGGGIGSALRYFSSRTIDNIFNTKFALGTIFVNCLGALLVGLLFNIFVSFPLDNKWKLFAIVGFLGGYTTFSAYSLETINYFVSGNIKYAVMNILVSNVLCLLFVLLGMWLSRIIFVK